MLIGTVTGSSITENKDDNEKRVLLQVTFLDDDDVQTVELILPPGEDSRPLNGSAILAIEVDESYKFAIGVDDGIEPESEPGEKELYSLGEDGLKKGRIKLDKLGSIIVTSDEDIIYTSSKNIRLIAAEKIILTATQEIQMQGGVDFAVQFTALQLAFNQLRTDFNALATVVTTHAHGGVTTGPGVSAVSDTPGVPSTADMTAAKVLTVRLP